MAATLAPAAPVSTPKLTAQDRCDRCGAQAYVRAQVTAGELLFCGHHANKHRDAIITSGGRILEDNTESLRENRLKGEAHA